MRIQHSQVRIGIVRDVKTGLGNRDMILKHLEEMLALDRQGKSLTVLLLDLDGFQNLNDNLGHRAGDEALIEAAARFRQLNTESAIHPASVLTRVGADEFAFVVDGTPAEQTEALAKSLLACLARPFLLEGSEVPITACAGIAHCTNSQTVPAELLRDARLAMFHARREGPNRRETFDPQLRHRAHARRAMVTDLYQALDRNQMRVFYQAKADLQTGSVVGFEALLRWQHPRYGLVQPSDFIPLAEETGLIIPLGIWVLRQACIQMHLWQTQLSSLPPLSMNVNLSVKQLADPKLVSGIESILAETGIRPETLHLEITESALIPELESVRQVLAGLRALRIGLTLDDFGTGYSSLSCLRTLHFDSLKIDRSFVQRLDSDPESRAIVETILRLARSLRMTVVAEGIENEEQRASLIELGCETGQGFLFSKPVAAPVAEQLLQTHLTAA